MPSMRRTILTAVTALIWLVALASPAAAHTVSGVGATNWRTTLSGISPAVPGLSLKIVESGSRLELTNRGPEVVVLGYEQEPYLRVGPQGVFENVLSPATYLNCSRIGCAVSLAADPQSPPRWKHLSSSQTVRWHDHRIHWMGAQLPPDVRRAPGQVHQRPPWTVTLKQGLTPITVTGHLTWVPGPSPVPWLLLALALLAGAAIVGLSGFWGVALAGLVALVTVSDIYHALAIGFSVAGSFWTQMLRFLTGSFYSMIGWVLGLLAVRLLIGRRVDGLYAAAFAGVSAALFTGLLDITVLSRSEAPFAGPISLDRVTVALSLGLGIGVAVGSIVALRRVARPEHDDDDDPETRARVEPGPEPGPAPA
jgi:hypothetical protein